MQIRRKPITCSVAGGPGLGGGVAVEDTVVPCLDDLC